jgi:uncharacterized protein
MMADDLSAPLGQRRRRHRIGIRVPIPAVVAGALALFLGAFAVWALVGDDPLGGEPIVDVPAHLNPVAANAGGGTVAEESSGAGPRRYDGPTAPAGPAKNQPSATTTVNIINGMTGDREIVTIPVPGEHATAAPSDPVDQKFVEMTRLGALPKIAANGVRPADAFAQAVKPLPGRPDAPRIAIIVSGLGVSAAATTEAIEKLPGPITLAFVPYGNDAALAALARHIGHEVLLEVPMEPFDYPNNDSGPQTLLASLTVQQNTQRLYWAMSRFAGYVGLMNMMGARFTASEQAFAPVLQEAAKRGLIYVDDGSNPRSVAGRIAGADSLPFARAEVAIDAVPTPAEIDRALGRLETLARERHTAVGIASALPVSIAHIAEWAKAAANRGILLVPITAVVTKEKQS